MVSIEVYFYMLMLCVCCAFVVHLLYICIINQSLNQFIMFLPHSIVFGRSFLASFTSFGFGGCRRPSPVCVPAASALFAGVGLVGGCDSVSVLTSCGSGVPAAAVSEFSCATVFRASDFRGAGFRGSFAARAAALIRSLVGSSRPLWCCFPAVACPSVAAGGVGRSWLSCGSGSWSECRLAAGLGCAVLVFLPSGIEPPMSWGQWSFVQSSVVGGSFWFLPSPSEVVQGSLFE